MKTATDLPDAILRQAKKLAAVRGIIFKQVFAEVLEKQLRRRAATRSALELGGLLEWQESARCPIWGTNIATCGA